MNEEIAQLQETVAALRAELDEVKGRLARIERVVRCGTEEDDLEEGGFAAHIECAGLVIRQVKDPRWFAVQLGAIEDGGFLSVFYQGDTSETACQPAISLHMEDNEPHIQVRGRDYKPRADTFIAQDCGMTAVFSPGGAPGAIMRAQPAGGSVAVLQPDGKTRGVLMHTEKPLGGGQGGAATDLIFAQADGNTVLKLHADAGGGSVSMGPPGFPNAATMVGIQGLGASMQLRSPDNGPMISLLAAGPAAQIAAMQGGEAGKGVEASLTVHDDHSSLSLHRPNGQKGVDLSTDEVQSNLRFLGADGESAANLYHHSEAGSKFSLSGGSEHGGIRMIAGNDLSNIEVASPDDPDTKVICMVNGDKPMVMLNQEKRLLAMMGESNGSGTICAYGPTAEQAGIACLAGGAVTGSLSLAQADGTQLLTLDGTDHGGRLAINNDLGFQRIVMGVHEEAAGLHLNHTGNRGVDLSATEAGGIVSVCDAAGNVVASLPEIEEEG